MQKNFFSSEIEWLWFIGNRTSCRSNSVCILVINKSDDRVISLITPISPVTIINIQSLHLSVLSWLYLLLLQVQFFFSENYSPTTCLEFALVSKVIPTQSGSCSFQSSRPWSEKIGAARKK